MQFASVFVRGLVNVYAWRILWCRDYLARVTKQPSTGWQLRYCNRDMLLKRMRGRVFMR
jgi:hypothetical protein